MSIEKLNNKIFEIRKEKNKDIDVIKKELKELYFKAFDDSTDLKKDLENIKNHSNGCYQFDEAGEINFCYRMTFKYQNDNFELECLREYVNDINCSYIDVIDGDLIASNFLGDCIVINYDGDIFEGHQLIISKNEYSDETERNELIEKHMEKTGCYPNVFECDYYSNLTSVSTL